MGPAGDAAAGWWISERHHAHGQAPGRGVLRTAVGWPHGDDVRVSGRRRRRQRDRGAERRRACDRRRLLPATAASASSITLPGALVSTISRSTARATPCSPRPRAARSSSATAPPAGPGRWRRWAAPAGTYVKPRVAINPAGMAVVIFRDNANLVASGPRPAPPPARGASSRRSPPGVSIRPPPTRRSRSTTPATSSPPTPTSRRPRSRRVRRFAALPDRRLGRVGRSQLGRRHVRRELRDRRRQRVGCRYPRLEADRDGFANVQARYGSTGMGIWGSIQTVNYAGADAPVAAIDDSGRAVVAWERELAISNNIGQARVREPVLPGRSATSTTSACRTRT